MFIPATPQELKARGWTQLDVILINGDATIDSPFSGISLIARQLEADGFKVGIISQPDPDSEVDISRLGEPALFWGVSAGSVDSMVANYTALKKPRRLDDHTPGGQNIRRPDRASIVYSNLIRKYFKNTKPIVLGGVEASLRRVVHYDYWSNSLRRSILLDAKADFLLYGMADFSVLAFARALRDGTDPKKLRGLCYPSVVKPADYMELPSYEECLADKASFARMFDLFYKNNDPITAQGLAQAYANRYVVQNPPAEALSTEEMDAVYSLPFTYKVHPLDAAQGEVRAFETIKHSIVTHRGCYGECSFCAISMHEGRKVSWRSEESILAEARAMTKREDFKGIITDLSGPTANMYGFECPVKDLKGACRDQACIYPQVCPVLPVDHDRQTKLLKALRELPGVRRVFISSGLRPDLISADANFGEEYMRELVGHHVSGQLKLAPEHVDAAVLRRMRKPGIQSTLQFKERFDQISEEEGKEQFLTYYMIAAYPGCGDPEMIALQEFCANELGVMPEQVQIFTPTPSTYGSLMYYTERDPWTGEQIFVEKGLTGKMQQKALITGWREKREIPQKKREPREAGAGAGRERRPRRPVRPSYETDRSDHHKAYQPAIGTEQRETRVIKDDRGRFLHNRLPEGWVEKQEERKKPWRPAPGDRDRGERGANQDRRPGSRPSSWERRGSERPGYQRDEAGKQGRPDRPYRRPEGSGSERAGAGSAKPRRVWDSREGTVGESPRPYERPSRPADPAKTDERRGYRAKDERSEGRPASGRPYRLQGQRKEGRPGGGRPYRRDEGSKPAEGSEKRPYKPRREGDAKPSAGMPYRPREGGASGRRSRPGRPGQGRPSGDRKPYSKRPDSQRSGGSQDRERKPREE